MQFDERTSRILTDWADSAANTVVSIFNQFQWSCNFKSGQEEGPTSKVPVQFQVRSFLEQLSAAVLKDPKKSSRANLDRLLVQKLDGQLVTSVIVSVRNLDLYGFKEEEVKTEGPFSKVTQGPSFNSGTLPPKVESGQVLPPETVPFTSETD